MSSYEINEDIVVTCPHCNEFIVIEKLNCKIFRHGILKIDGKQIDPHSSKEICDMYVSRNEIYGCGKPFIIVVDNSQNIQTKPCEYI